MKRYCIPILLGLFLCLAAPPSASAGKIHDLQDKLEMDKCLHFSAGYIINDQLKRHTRWSALERFLAVAAVGYAKEKWVDNHFDKRDLIATALGGAAFEIRF